MSLDITLKAVRPTTVFEQNITHNLTEMAEEAGLYKAVWRPDELGITHAGDLIPLLESGLTKLKNNPDHYKKFNPPNRWGSYDGLIEALEEYLTACIENPDAEISVWR